MPRHTRQLPRDRHERERAIERAASLLIRLEQQANEVQQLEATAGKARTRLQEQILRHIDARELDITDMATATGISRQSIHRLLRARKLQQSQPSVQQSQPSPEWKIGERVNHRSRGAGTIEEADGPALTVRFDRHDLRGTPQKVHAELAGITPL